MTHKVSIILLIFLNYKITNRVKWNAYNKRQSNPGKLATNARDLDLTL